MRQISTNILNTIAIAVILMASKAAIAWIDPISFDKDNGDELVTDTKTVNGVDRCDSPSSAYPSGVFPSLCHRWGLVWNLNELADPSDWLPGSVSDGYRLPTIKELVKLYDYTGGSGFAINELIYNHIVVKGALGSSNWLLSSSYRDIDGNYDVTSGSGRLQIFAINTLTGEVRAFEPGQKSGTDGLRMCTAVASNGDCTLDDSHSYYTLLVSQTLL